MSSFVKHFDNGEIWWCIDGFLSASWVRGYIKLRDIKEWYALGKDDVDWKDRVIKEKKFLEQTKGLTLITEPTPEMQKVSHDARAALSRSKAGDLLVCTEKGIQPSSEIQKPDAIIFDCDGTLLDCDLPPWQPQAKITPRVNTISLLRLLWRQSPRHPKIIILTGRPERIRKLTETQLLNNGIFCDELLMNNLTSGGETSPGHQFKIRKLPELMDKYNIIGMFEDDPQVIQSVRTIYPEISTYHVYD